MKISILLVLFFVFRFLWLFFLLSSLLLFFLFPFTLGFWESFWINNWVRCTVATVSGICSIIGWKCIECCHLSKHNKKDDIYGTCHTTFFAAHSSRTVSISRFISLSWKDESIRGLFDREWALQHSSISYETSLKLYVLSIRNRTSLLLWDSTLQIVFSKKDLLIVFGSLFGFIRSFYANLINKKSTENNMLTHFSVIHVHPSIKIAQISAICYQ